MMDYKKKNLDKISCNNSYEEIDTRLASGWYVDSIGKNKKKWKNFYFFAVLEKI